MRGRAIGADGLAGAAPAENTGKQACPSHTIKASLEYAAPTRMGATNST